MRLPVFLILIAAATPVNADSLAVSPKAVGTGTSATTLSVLDGRGTLTATGTGHASLDLRHGVAGAEGHVTVPQLGIGLRGSLGLGAAAAMISYARREAAPALAVDAGNDRCMAALVMSNATPADILAIADSNAVTLVPVYPGRSRRGFAQQLALQKNDVIATALAQLGAAAGDVMAVTADDRGTLTLYLGNR